MNEWKDKTETEYVPLSWVGEFWSKQWAVSSLYEQLYGVILSNAKKKMNEIIVETYSVSFEPYQ